MAFATGNTYLPGYVMPMGDKNFIVFDHTGPASYTQFSSPTTGGDVVNAADLNQGGFDYIDTTTDTTGQIVAYAIFSLGGWGNAVPKVIIAYFSLVTATVGGQAQTLGAQVAAATNLSTFSFRFKAICV